MPENNGWRTSPLYTIAEAAHLAHVSPMTVRNWLYGYHTKDRDVLPILGEQEKKPLVSFLEFVEIIIARGFRKNHISLPRIRDAHDFAEKEWGINYSFAHMKLEPLGGHILHRFDAEQPGRSLATLDTKLQQWTLPGLVIERLHEFDYELDFVSRWHPVGKGVPIVVDPQVNAGLPTFENRRITVQTIYKRWKAEYPISVIASDLKLKRYEIEEILRHAPEVLV